MLRRLILTVAVIAVPAVATAGSAEDNVALLMRFYDEAINGGQLELMDEYLADDFVEHEELPGMRTDREGVKEWFAGMWTPFPDLKFEVEFTVADADKVVAYLTITGTQAAEFMGIPSQGRAFEVKTIDIIQFADGKAVAHWGVTDTGVLMQQLMGDGVADE